MVLKYLFSLILILLFISIGLNIRLFNFQQTRNYIDPSFNRSKLMQMSCGFLLSRAIQVFAQLKLADHLKSPQKIDNNFANKLNVNQSMLYRLLRMLSGHGIVHKNGNDEFILTEIGQYLRTDHPETLCNFFEMEGNPHRWNSYSKLPETIKTGTTSFNILFGESYFDSIKKNPFDQDQFNRGMNDISNNENLIIAYFFKNKKAYSIVDIGGGVGNLLLEIIAINVNIKEAILFDYTPLTNNQKNLIDLKNIKFIQGSFFEKNVIPPNKDIYILKRILHDWNDENSIKILSQIQKTMSKESKLYILDSIMDDTNNYHISKDVDFEMMVLFGGKERTKNEFEKILQKANLKLIKIHNLENSMLSILEVHKK